MEICELHAREITDKVVNKEKRALDVYDSCLRRSISFGGKSGAFITMTLHEARSDARKVDNLIAEGNRAGKLAGVPFAVKDNIAVCGVRTTAGSKMLYNWISPYSATVVELLRNEGAILMGKTSMTEFALLNDADNPDYVPTSNLWDTSRANAESHEGSAAVVAAGCCPFSLGSDTCGEIRRSAAESGVYGFKPTHGMVSRYGLIANASSLDNIGVFTRSLEDLELVMQIISSPDVKDSTCASGLHNIDFPDGARILRIGIIEELKDLKIHPAIREAQERAIGYLRDLGIEIVEISMPVAFKFAVPSYYAIAASEANTNLARFDGVRYGYSVSDASSLTDLYTRTRSEGFGIQAKRSILAGTYLAASENYEKYYIPALKVRQMIAREFAEAFLKLNSILLPAVPELTPREGGKEDQTAHLVFSVPANLAGLPSLTFNAGFCAKTNLPVGLQLLGKRWRDPAIITIAKLLEPHFHQ
ncbi:MAG: aspartyl/glutamyl-tRNA amidotransferase subunit A [Synergistaceae bacterium]|nr:aspartyl/glutamyl-tRNA amidotransferase subunit A [Synergistaceae bacterium]